MVSVKSKPYSVSMDKLQILYFSILLGESRHISSGVCILANLETSKLEMVLKKTKRVYLLYSGDFKELK